MSAQYLINGYSEPYRLDRTINGGGLLFYVRNDITTKRLPLNTPGIECILTEITLSKTKWLAIGFYNPKESKITNTHS